MVVLHWDALVLVSALEVVGTVGRHVEQSGDSNGVQNLSFRGVKGAAEVQEGEDLNRAALDATQKGLFLKSAQDYLYFSEFLFHKEAFLDPR